MGFRFRKSINLGKGFRVNLSKSGVGASWGTRGFRMTKTASGKNRATVSIPGTGISYSKDLGGSRKKSRDGSSGWITGVCILLGCALIAAAVYFAIRGGI